MARHDICQRLLDKAWRSYACELYKAPEVKGIYAIGIMQTNGDVLYRYVGQSYNIHRRLKEHKYKNMTIDKFVKQEFCKNNGMNLRIKWAEKALNVRCVEGNYLNCISKRLGYWPGYNASINSSCYHPPTPGPTPGIWIWIFSWDYKFPAPGAGNL